jgi:hypothetical protein
MMIVQQNMMTSPCVAGEMPPSVAHMHGFAAALYAFGVLLVMMLTGGEVVEFPVEIGGNPMFSHVLSLKLT